MSVVAVLVFVIQITVRVWHQGKVKRLKRTRLVCGKANGWLKTSYLSAHHLMVINGPAQPISSR